MLKKLGMCAVLFVCVGCGKQLDAVENILDKSQELLTQAQQNAQKPAADESSTEVVANEPESIDIAEDTSNEPIVSTIPVDGSASIGPFSVGLAASEGEFIAPS